MDDSITPSKTEHGIREETAQDSGPGSPPWEGADPAGSQAGNILLCILLACPLSCILLVPVTTVVRGLATGKWPIGDRGGFVHEGMTAAEVKALLGEPHDRHIHLEGGESWYYWTDSLGLGLCHLGIHIDDQGIVTQTWI